MGNNKKFILGFFLALVVLTATFAFADSDSWTESSTPDITDLAIYVDDVLAWSGSCNYNATTLVWDCLTSDVATPAIERGEMVSVKAVFTAGNNASSVKVKAEITGYDKDIEAKTASFDLFANSSYTKVLSLKIPNDIDEGDYKLHIEIEDKSSLSGISEAKIGIKVQRVSYLLEILSVDCYGNFEAGSTFYTDVVVKNRGSDEAEDVYVNVNIAELGISRTVYLGDLAEVDDDDEDAKKVTVALTLPETAKVGDYQLNVKAYNRKTSTEKTTNIVVEKISETSISGERKIVITPETTTSKVEQGKGVAYTMTIANYGSKTAEIEIETEGTKGWATVQITPQTFSLEAGKTETVSIYIVVNEDAVAAEHIFTATIKYNGNAEQISMSANVVKTTATLEPKTVLTIIAAVLLVVIIVLLVILLTRKESKQIEETYY